MSKSAQGDACVGREGNTAARRVGPGVMAAAVATALLAAACGRPAGPVPEVPSLVVGHCIYVNNFSNREECREYLGDGWTAATAQQDCQGRSSTAVIGAACGYPQMLGRCILNANRPDVVRIAFPGNDASRCSSSQNGCEFFGGGFFVPEPVCQGASSDGGSIAGGLPVFQQPVLECRDPRAGERPGAGPNGQVCTWSAVPGATEEGRHFEDYGSCDRVRTQRPYYPVPPAPAPATPDPRMQDPAYVAELGWVRSQVEASACVCCHSNRITPRGPSNWYVEAPGNWMSSFSPLGLALGSGWVDSSALGAYPAEQNNGFARTVSGVPSTDPVRMARFFERELEHRGVTRDTFRSVQPFGGPIYTQTTYQPQACQANVGVNSEGRVRWSGGGARYVYVLEAGSANPGVPPNFDTPAGTLWRLDVPSDQAPIASGIAYGQAPAGTVQRQPAMMAPPALVAQRQYYLYVLADVGIPITRCTFAYPR